MSISNLLFEDAVNEALKAAQNAVLNQNWYGSAFAPTWDMAPASSSTAAGAAYTAALSPEFGDAFIADMEREAPEAVKILKPRIEANRQSLRERGYVVACGLWSPHINGLAVPIWSPQYQTFVVITIGLLSAMYDEERLHAEVAPLMLALGRSLGSLMEGAEGDVFNSRISRKPVAMAVHNNNKPINSEGVNELEAGTRRARPARSLRAGDGRR